MAIKLMALQERQFRFLYLYSSAMEIIAAKPEDAAKLTEIAFAADRIRSQCRRLLSTPGRAPYQSEYLHRGAATPRAAGFDLRSLKHRHPHVPRSGDRNGVQRHAGHAG
jgi:hypothetical protein